MKSVINGIAGAIIVYLCFSFANATLDISVWDALDRGSCALFMLVGAFAGFFSRMLLLSPDQS